MLIDKNQTVVIDHFLARVEVKPKRMVAHLMIKKLEDILDRFSKTHWDADLFLIGKHHWKPGQILVFYRESLRYSQKELAKRVKIDPSVICKFENHQREISKKTALKLSKVLGCHYQELL